MAGYSEMELLPQIHQQINGFSESEDMPELPEPEALAAEQQSCLERLEALQKEVAMLEEAKHQLASQSHLSMKDVYATMSSEKVLNIESQTPETSTGNDLARLKSELELLHSVTGINMKDCRSKILSVGRNKLKRQHMLEGHCFGITFKQIFTVEETQISESEHHAVITDLQIEVDEKADQPLKAWISRSESLCDIQQFFRVFVSYAEQCSLRLKALTFFKNQFPDVVSLPHGTEGSVFEFKNPNKPGAVWVIHWSVRCSDNGSVSPHLDLAIKVPKSMLEMDSEKILKDAPLMFKNMLANFGVAKAINTIVTLVTQ